MQTTEGEQIAQLIAGYIDIILKKVTEYMQVCSLETLDIFTVLYCSCVPMAYYIDALLGGGDGLLSIKSWIVCGRYPRI